MVSLHRQRNCKRELAQNFGKYKLTGDTESAAGIRRQTHDKLLLLGAFRSVNGQIFIIEHAM